MRDRKFRQIIYPGIAITILVILAICVIFISTMSRRYVSSQSLDNLSETAKIVQNYIDQSNIYIDEIESIPDGQQLNDLLRIAADGTNTRITYILPNGLVVADTEEDPAVMDNHRTRPEILRALAGYEASSIRYSNTVEIDMLYLAVPLWDNEGSVHSILRVAMPYQELEQSIRSILLYTIIGSILFLLLSVFLILFIDRKIEKPILGLSDEAVKYQNLQFDDIIPIKTSSIEIKNLSGALRNMALDLKNKIDAISQQKHEIQSILDAMDEAILVLNSHGEIVRANPSAQKLFSSEDFEKIYNKYYMQIIPNTEMNAALEPLIRESTTDPDKLTQWIEIQFNQKSFRIFISILSTKPDKTILVVFNDITKLMHLEKVRSDFVANVSHELKTPVTSIKGFTETLLYQDINPKDEQYKKFLQIIHNQTDRLQAIIEDLLTLSMLEQREKQHVFEQINLISIIKDSVRICLEKPVFSDRKVTICCNYENLLITCNPLLIEQALINLIDNALKYSDAATEIVIDCKRNNGFISIFVKDRGYGIPQELIPRIFERFYRVDKGRSRDKGGTGLGLSIVRHIAMKHDGNVSVESVEGIGSTFTLQLPINPGS